MKLNTYIISEKGFLESTIFNKETNKLEITWCERIKDANAFTKKQAKAKINNYRLDAFIWSPFKEFETESLYEVKFINRNHFSFEGEEFGIWEIQKYFEKDSDFNHLRNKKNDINKPKLYSKTEARKIVFEKNKKMIEKINHENLKYIESQAKKFKL